MPPLSHSLLYLEFKHPIILSHFAFLCGLRGVYVMSSYVVTYAHLVTGIVVEQRGGGRLPYGSCRLVCYVRLSQTFLSERENQKIRKLEN